MVEVGTAKPGTGKETQIAAQGTGYGPHVGGTGPLTPLADNLTDEGCVIVVGRRAKRWQQSMQIATMAGDRPLRQTPMNA